MVPRKYKNCKYLHVLDEQKQRTEPRKKGSNRTNNSSEFIAWRNEIPLSLSRVRPLGSKLAWFFKEGRGLIEVDDGVLQEVIRCLAQEGGLRRIQELIEWKYSHLSSSAKKPIFHAQVLPFIEIITHYKVLASLVLEQAVGTIYNFIFGPAGRRAEPFLQFLVDAVELEIEGQRENAAFYLGLSLLVFSQVVELNSTAFIHEPLKPLAKRFEHLFMNLHALETARPLDQARHYLVKLQRRLDIGSSLPTLYERPKPGTIDKPPVTFTTQKDPPGGRHDNDHADICQIKVMPTFQEILCSRSEYLPVINPRQWHVGGLDGLLDRNFRLLREDTIGQLRDIIHVEMRPVSLKETQKNQTRTHVYRQVRVGGFDFDRFDGFKFLIEFAQPSNVHGMSKGRRQEWWQLSKRLQPSALVCLADRRGFAIFCTVAGPDRPDSRSNAHSHHWRRKAASLWEDANVASVTLELVESTENSLQYLLDCHSQRKDAHPISLVEFPGVLLPSFQPTLLALQRMKRAEEFPMSEFLAPQDMYISGCVNVPPPVYATNPGFSFDLRCLMKDRSSLEVQHSQPVDLKRLQKNSILDDAQAVALVSTLQRRIGLIQGPPGTGKSFTGVALIKVLLANKSRVKTKLGPIVCVCYTNHALDQLLEDLLEKQITSQIIRIGSRSKSESLQPLNLRTVAKQVDKTRLERREQFELHENLEESEKKFHSLRLEAEGSDRSLEYYLKAHDLHHYRQFFGKDEDGFIRNTGRKPQKIIKQWLNSGLAGNGQTRSLKELSHIHVDQMAAKERKLLYKHWVKENRENLHSQARSAFISHQKAKTSFDKVRDEIDLRCLRSADVIGVTTSGLARSLNMLRRLQSKVILCEEAGEVLEAHLLTSLLPSVEHLILIGDHLQLRPQIQNYKLSRENQAGQQYSLDLSLFERLVQPTSGIGVQVPFCTLKTQRRMHPSIAQLVRDTLYPQLEDAPSVSEYPEVTGMRKRLFWLDHCKPEGGASSQDAMATSHWNDYEIELSVALVNHLLRQGSYQSGEIALLTPYLGQLHRIRRRLSQSFTIVLGERDQEDLDNAGFTADEALPTTTTVSKSTLLQTLRVATVDNFQGEEAKVVVISLVRSNSQNRCGFLRTPNRINVLLSRAQHGMYIIGNSTTSRHVEMWQKVLEILEQNGNIGTSLELKCPRHPDDPIAVSEPEHFVQFSPEGGCSLRCSKRLQCGHPCKQKCHSELLHKAVSCLEPCLRLREGCAHACPKVCGDPCPRHCTIPVFDAARALPCGHLMAKLPCWQAQDLSTVECPTVITLVNVLLYVAIIASVAALHVQYAPRRVSRLTMGGVNKNAVGYTLHAHMLALLNAMANLLANLARPAVMCNAVTPDVLGSVLSRALHVRCLNACLHVHIARALCPVLHHVIIYHAHAVARKFCSAVISARPPVDFILGQTYREIDLNENPCIFPQCGHFLTMENMDAQMDLKRYYTMDEMDKPISIASSSQPFSMDDIKTCATCRGSLRSISRYGRLVRRALLDEATKKFILYVNQQFVPMAQELPRLIASLRDHRDTAIQVFQDERTIKIEGPPDHQVQLMNTLLRKHDKTRWKALMALRQQITGYRKKVRLEEQPFKRVRDMVENARRHKQLAGQFQFDENVLQTKGFLQASGLLLRLDTALLADFVFLYKKARVKLKNSDVHMNLQANKKDCASLINMAASSQRVLQQVEGYLFLAQLCAMEHQCSAEPAQTESFLKQGHDAIKMAHEICSRHPGQTRGLNEEIKGTVKMLLGATFYTPITTQERMAVMAAMAREFRGTGHWYYCQNGHPFTIGECGGAVELSTCPECGSPVGGQGHRTIAGVTRANDLEENFRRLDISH
ncbi:hypothetical protein PRK78_000268 [Emydomyces testavorans]|uniref:RZ-type domain-containing protein n=1 Tax=Emydomyces testavorans TaxID=2070801 RepID=A0AAF0DAD3_9EURO|nr:hypothetical protein PRK78_000268 [Emydomyces testavorans]